jgi:hypothetical protein
VYFDISVAFQSLRVFRSCFCWFRISEYFTNNRLTSSPLLAFIFLIEISSLVHDLWFNLNFFRSERIFFLLHCWSKVSAQPVFYLRLWPLALKLIVRSFYSRLWLLLLCIEVSCLAWDCLSSEDDLLFAVGAAVTLHESLLCKFLAWISGM